MICDSTGSKGAVAALDLAPENVRRAEGVVSKVNSGPLFSAQVGSILSLPFDDRSFDCVWSANVMQYLTPEEFRLAVEEANRVLKPGGILAIKDFDSTMLQILPMDHGVFSRFMVARLRKFRERGVLGTDCGSTLPARLRAPGWTCSVAAAS